MEADGSAPKTAAEHRGTQRAMAYALAAGQDPTLRYDLGVIRGLHFMVQESKPEAFPGRWRDTPVRVGSRWQTVYTAPDCDDVPRLMDAFEGWLGSSGDEPTMVRAAMAHFILVKIHPFKDGNGRTARALAGLPERMNVILFDAANDLEVTNGAYRATAEVSAQVASRDLSAALAAGLLARHGANRGARYVAGAPLVAAHDAIMRSRAQLDTA